MDKAKIKFVIEVEYEQNPEHYPEGLSREDKLKLDLEEAKSDPLLLIESLDAEWEITGELL